MLLKEYRLKRHMTLEQLAEACGISWRNLQRIENGQYKSAKFATVQKLIKVLNMEDKDILKFIKESKIVKIKKETFENKKRTIKI